ncbi:MAG TPA: LuxR C-terminal-related transcriptional regulator, partial [Nannocystaceae bacterium]|nr:LuxR C-terminal-related transcriptional regulator [Nannocystaceae bacterium]
LLRPGDQIQLGPDTVVVFAIERGAAKLGEHAAKRQEIARTLTARELEVAIAVARGWTNLKVARELAVSVRTVESHLDHVYNKLDVDSRSELTALLHRVGLADPR